MARISIKKNFVDGDKLFAQQLNNNFETIEKAVNDGNKIVWQDGTEVTFKRYVTSDIDSLPISDGAIIYDTEKGRHYIDYQGKRIQVGSAGKEVVIQEEQPTEEDNKLWIDSNTVNTIGTEIVNEHTESETLGYSANYLNDRIVKVSPTQPETGEEVWIQKSKNLFDKNNANILHGYIISGTSTIADESVGRTLYIPCEPNTKYTITKLASRFNVGYTTELPYIGCNIYSVMNGGYDLTKMTYETGTNAKYLVVFYHVTTITDPTEKEVLDSIQIEKGSVASSYEPYTNKKIYIKNDNGGYEKFYDETDLEHYSTSEQRIGTWLGKPLYRKILVADALKDNGETRVFYDSTYIIQKFDIYVENPGSYKFHLPIAGANYISTFNVIDHNYIAIQTSSDRTAFTKNYVIIEYTKITD